MRLRVKIFLGFFAVIILIVILSLRADYIYKTKEEPISLVKAQTNFYSLEELVKKKEGDITIYGFTVKIISDKPNTYLVSYTYATADERKIGTFEGWWWEANTKADIVRKVTGDVELEKRYRLGQTKKNLTLVPDEETTEKSEELKKKLEESKAQWRQLEKGMTQAQVRAILGEPERVIAPISPTIDWYYPNGGMLEFYNNYSGPFLLSSWTEPQWTD